MRRTRRSKHGSSRIPGRLQVAVALDHLRAGRKDEAISTLRKALRENPDNVDALHTLAQAYWGDDRAGVRHRSAAAPGDGARARPRCRLDACSARCYTKRIAPTEAIACYRRAAEIAPDNASAWSGLGADYAQIGDMEKSVAAYARSVALQPGLPGIHMSHAHVLKSLGRQAEALREYRAAIAQKPDFGEVYWSMANLKVFRFEPAEVAAMEAAAEARGSEPESRHAFPLRARARPARTPATTIAPGSSITRGNQRSARWCSTIRSGFEVRHEQIAEVFSREFLERARGRGISSPTRPIFIVGLPRSGSTLIEQILASHSQVEGTVELPTLGEIAVSIGRYSARPRGISRKPCANLRGRDFRAYGKQYLEETADLPHDRTGRASPTSCRTTSRTSVSCT